VRGALLECVEILINGFSYFFIGKGDVRGAICPDHDIRILTHFSGVLKIQNYYWHKSNHNLVIP